jgi:uncharacterized UPF0160 family protein
MDPRLVTHSGVFHIDDLMSAAVLTTLYPQKVIRTRDPMQWADDKAPQVVFDVGRQYDPARGRFDHHFKGARKRTNGVTYSSFGLVWDHFGRDYLRRLGITGDNWERIDRTLALGVDCVDTGHHGSGSEIKQAKSSVTPLYDACPFLNAFWNEADDRFNVSTEQLRPALARYARTLDRGHMREFRNAAMGRADAYYESLNEAKPLIFHHLHGEILELPQPMPWNDVVTPNNAPNLKLVIWPDDLWRMRTVPTTLHGHQPKVPLPKEWWGLEDDDLRSVTGVTDAVFCHPGGFIAGARSRQGIHQLKHLALDAFRQAQTVAPPQP